MTRHLTPLERRGLEALAHSELELYRRAAARLLVFLIAHADQTWPYEQLTTVGAVGSRPAMNRDYCIRCLQRVRECLVDVGFDPAAITVEPSVGFRMPAEHAAAVLGWLEARA